jgi:hypothetical protein
MAKAAFKKKKKKSLITGKLDINLRKKLHLGHGFVWC